MNVMYSRLITAGSGVRGECLWQRKGYMRLLIIERATSLCHNTLVILRKEDGRRQLELRPVV